VKTGYAQAGDCLKKKGEGEIKKSKGGVGDQGKGHPGEDRHRKGEQGRVGDKGEKGQKTPLYIDPPPKENSLGSTAKKRSRPLMGQKQKRERKR